MEPGNSKLHGFNMTFVYTVFVVTLLFFLADVDFSKYVRIIGTVHVLYRFIYIYTFYCCIWFLHSYLCMCAKVSKQHMYIYVHIFLSGNMGHFKCE